MDTGGRRGRPQARRVNRVFLGHVGFAPRLRTFVSAVFALLTRKDKCFVHELLVKFDGDGFYFGVISEAVFAEFAADAGLLESAEWGRGVKHVVAVHPYGAGAHAVGNGVGFRDVLGPNGSGEAVDIFVSAL